jgi:hypothetical protein
LVKDPTSIRLEEPERHNTGVADQRSCDDATPTVGLELPLSIVDRLVVSQIVPLRAKLAAIEDCLSELKQTGFMDAKQRELEMHLRDALQSLKAAQSRLSS